MGSEMCIRDSADATLRRHVDLLHLQLVRPVSLAERELLASALHARTGGGGGAPGLQERARAAPPRPSGTHAGARSASSATGSSQVYQSPGLRSYASSLAPSPASSSARSSDALAASVARRKAARAALAAYSPRDARAPPSADALTLQRHVELLHKQLMGRVSEEERRDVLAHAAPGGRAATAWGATVPARAPS